MVTLAGCVFISKVKTSNPPIRIARFRNGSYRRKKDGGYILAGKSADWTVHEDWEMLLDGRELKGESIWRDFLQTHGPGIHHLKFSVDHLSPADEYLRGQGFACVQQGAAVGPNKGKTWAYYDLEGTLPLCIELMNEVIEQ